MRNLLTFLITLAICISAICTGLYRNTGSIAPVIKHRERIPHIGSVEVLNGCGKQGAAGAVADFLRKQNFDVKRIDNAPTWNYPATMVISREKDMAHAYQIGEALTTDRIVRIRTDETLYDVTVIVGPDYKERIEKQP
jgi:hypothetical protein